MTSDRKSTLEVLIEALFEAYPDDPSAPGVVVAKVREHPRPRYYVSVVRYERPLGEGRRVVASARGMDLGPTIRAAAQSWRAIHAKEDNHDQ